MEVRDLTVHATCVDLAGKGVLITGPSSSGKSALALELISLGAVLVADDRTCLSAEGGQIIASSPPAIVGMIEARGVGILTLEHCTQTTLALVVDMSVTETDRLPARRETALLDIPIRCLHKVDAPYFPSAIRAYLFGSENEVQ